jgi:N-acetylneuraminate synthase/N,N'-diacetyllegionaminate synthase
MRIGSKEIGPGSVFIIAEIGVNHNGRWFDASQLVDVAHAAGADAVKLQLFRSDMLLSRSASLAAYQRSAGETDPATMLARLQLPMEHLLPSVTRAHAHGMAAIVTVFSTDLIEKSRMAPWDAYKTASPDIVHKPMLHRLAAIDKPLIVSTGAASIEEVRSAADWLRAWGASDRLAMLQCVSSYPTPRDSAELGGIAAIRDAVGLPVGYSDHTMEEDTGAAAVRAGALILEKHITRSRKAKGPDHASSLEPEMFARYVALARQAAADGRRDEPAGPDRAKRILPSEQDVRRLSRQSAVAVRDLPAGHVLAAADVTIKRPGTGVPAARIDELPGRRLARPVARDTVIEWEALA